MFVVFEGIDGSGKTTQAGLLAKNLFSMPEKHEVVLTREPTPECKKKIKFLRESNKSTPKKEAKVYAKYRKKHVEEVIKPALERGAIVICDRYLISSLVYQAYDGVDMEITNLLNRGILLPDMTFKLECDPEKCFSRISSSRSKIEQHENPEALRELSEMFNQAIKKLDDDSSYYPTLHISDSNLKSQEKISEDIFSYFQLFYFSPNKKRVYF